MRAQVMVEALPHGSGRARIAAAILICVMWTLTAGGWVMAALFRNRVAGTTMDLIATCCAVTLVCWPTPAAKINGALKMALQLAILAVALTTLYSNGDLVRFATGLLGGRISP